MPVPLIELQRRLSLVGAIRAGGEKPQRGVGRKLDSWRITSPRRQLVEQAASLYGGDVTEWQSPVGQEFQCYTKTDELPVLLMPSYSLRQTYELWEGATKRTRLCDGVDEELSGGPCICNATGDDKCDLYTRLVVALPELDTLLGWRVITRGVNAAHELPTMIAAAQSTSGGRPFVPARLRLEQRRGVVDGQVARFVVPTLDLAVGYAALVASHADGSVRALASGDTGATPIGSRQEPTVEQALDAVVSPSAPNPRRRAAAFGADTVDVDDVTAPNVRDEPTFTAPPPRDEPTNDDDEREQTFMATDAQKTKLNVLVGTLREQGKVATDGLYNAVATRLRGTGGLDLAMTTPDYVDDKGVTHKAIDEEGQCHWAPLREVLTRQEAHQLIEWLVKVEARPSDDSPADEQPAAPASTEEPDPEPEQQELATGDERRATVPYGQFPPGY